MGALERKESRLRISTAMDIYFPTCCDANNIHLFQSLAPLLVAICIRIFRLQILICTLPDFITLLLYLDHSEQYFIGKGHGVFVLSTPLYGVYTSLFLRCNCLKFVSVPSHRTSK